MKRLLLQLLAVSGLSGTIATAQTSTYSTLWHTSPQHPAAAGRQVIEPQLSVVHFTTEAELQQALQNVPADYASATIIDLPTPEGNYRSFKVWRNETMSEGLQAKYPGITALTAEATDNRLVTAKLDYTSFGFHAMVFDLGHVWFVDPLTNQKTGYYQSYNKSDYTRPVNQRMSCELKTNGEDELGDAVQLTQTGLPKMGNKTNGTSRKKYRLALACTVEYSAAVGGATPTKASVLSAMVTSINRVNGVYEREFSVTMTLIPNTDTLIYLSGTDPYTNNNGSTMLGQNQTTVDTRIGDANYDFGHVFSTGGGGIANLGCICESGGKAQGVTGSPSPVGDSYDIDYVAHEMGHQFGGNHTFNNNSEGSCSGNAVQQRAYEPGSGTTIMAYAGICPGEDMQQHSDAYFHGVSFIEISGYITTGNGGDCPVVTTSTNTNATIPTFQQVISVPYGTPFEITAPVASDNTADTLLYCWEMWNRGNFGALWANTMSAGPIFRSFNPDTARTRVFPTISKLVNNVTSYLGEKLPDTSRTMMRFMLSERDIYQGYGCYNLSDDTIRMQVQKTSGPFLVTAPNTVVTWAGGSTQTVTWDVANTTAAPVSTANVNIFLSTDGGYTYPTQLAANVVNNGSATVTVPNINTTTARIKVKAANNVFFDISNANFKITPSTTGINTAIWAGGISVYPVPAHDALTITSNLGSPLRATILNALGQTVWTGAVSGATQVSVSGWAPGIYAIRLSNPADGSMSVKQAEVR